MAIIRGFYGRISLAFFLSAVISYIIIILPSPSLIILFVYSFTFFPFFLILWIASMVTMFVLTRTSFALVVNKRNINIASIAIIAFFVIFSVFMNTYIASEYGPFPSELLGDWVLDEGQEQFNITNLYFSYDLTYGRNDVFMASEEITSIQFNCEYDRTSNELYIYEHSDDKWELTLRLDIDASKSPYSMITYYMSESGQPPFYTVGDSGPQYFFNSTRFDGKTWTKID